jgi:mono/diheme cytochrome c family protein
MNKKFAALSVSFLIITILLAACSGPAPKAPQAVQAPQGPAQPDVPNPGGPGQAINLTGDPVTGADVFAKCAACHGKDGKGGQANPGSDAGTIPALNPVNPALKNADAKTFATNLDLFIEHGGTPKGSNPARSMIAYGDRQMLTPQQIADVIAYIISLNK